MRPVRLQVVGLRSWKTERELKFEGIDLAAVIGPTGAGKSSILEAIVYALFNASTYERRGVGSLISSDGKTMSVTLDFDADGERWRVTRSTSRNNYPPSVHKITCLTHPAEHPPIEGERAVNAAIEALIGLDLDQFLTAVLLPQGRFQTLLMAARGERAGILKGVFRLDELDEIRERAALVRRHQVEPALEARQTERAQLLPDPEATLVEATAEVDRCTEVVEKLSDIKVRYDGLIERTSGLDTAVRGARQLADTLGTAAGQIPSLDDAVQAETELGKAEEELRGARTRQLARRDQAQAQLDGAASERITVETLAAARHVLETAQKTLPTLEIDERRLNAARDSLVAQQRTLDKDTHEHSQHLGQRASAEEAVSALKTSSERAGARLIDATNALRGLRSADEHAVRARGAVSTHEDQLATATTNAETAAGQATRDKAAAEGAEAVFDAARKAHQAAHLAAGLHAGDPCPICERELSDDFSPPQPPTALASAESEAKRLRQISDDSNAAATRAAANLDALEEHLARLRGALAAADENAAQARKQAEDLLGPIEAESDDSDLLAPVKGAAETAKGAYEDADRELSATKARLEAVSESLRQRSQTCTDRNHELELEMERITRERDAQTTALAGLPPEFRPTGSTHEFLAPASEACSARLAEIQALHAEVRAANKDVEGLDRQLTELARTRTETVDTPRREAAGLAREIAAKVREVRPDRDLPKQPAEATAIVEHAAWVRGIVEVAFDVAKALSAKADEDEAASTAAKSEAEELLHVADNVVEDTIAAAADLDRQLNGWRARLLAAERDRARAAEQIPKAALLDTQIEELRSRRESLDEVTRLLGDGHFIKWLVERRQQLLLIVASEIFAGITGGRYRFAADFTIIDGRTGIARHPRTLSGGESFMASLSLALGMAEIAARSGGRIGSLYLDEGFGALDPNALDEAITALELRARSGQMILIVSHVPAIAQRIERVLEVRPDAAGSSAEWLDDADRESLLVDAALDVS